MDPTLLSIELASGLCVFFRLAAGLEREPGASPCAAMGPFEPSSLS